MMQRRSQPRPTTPQSRDEDEEFALIEAPLRGYSPKANDRKRKLAALALLSAVIGGLFAVFLLAPKDDLDEIAKSNNMRGRAIDLEEKECTVWLAPSSIRGVDGYGVFTTRDMKSGDEIVGADLGIPITHYGYDGEPKVGPRRLWKHVWDNYWWGRGVPDHVSYDSPPSIVDFQTGFGTFPNHHCALAHLSTKYPDPPYIDGVGDRYSNPGAGAFSYNRGRVFKVTRDLQAGDEFFLNYGYCTRSSSLPEWTQHIYMKDDFKTAATMMSDYRRYKKGLSFDDNAKLVVPEETLGFVKELLPKNKKLFDKILESSDSIDQLVFRLADLSLNKRTPEWIRKNGHCFENLVARTSLLPRAGQGAFAQRTIRKGEMVVPAPLMQVIDRDSLDLYNSEGIRNGTQLLLNYCFGHRKSSMLLCPGSNAVLINHCSTRTKECGRKGPNADYRWSTGWDVSSEAWRNLSISDIAKMPGRGLAFEIFATRDIRPGDEVFIDYGLEWEEAWKKHVATWKPPLPPVEGKWISAQEANADTGPIRPEFISGNLRKVVEHPYLFTGCQYWTSGQDKHEVYTQQTAWEKMSDEDIIKRYADSGASFAGRSYDRHYDQNHWPCSVLRQEGDGSYIVRIHASYWNSRQPWHKNNVPRLLRNYPRESIHYFVHPYAGDQHLPGAFRHPMGIREELMSKQWLNLS